MASSDKPETPEGYIGPQPTFASLGLKPMTHQNPVLSTRNNRLEIKFKESGPVKVTHQLIDCRDEKDVSEYVFSQSKDGVVHFLVYMPDTAWYRLQLFGLPQADTSQSLPNIYNYLINCLTVLLPAHPFPHQYAQWRNGCYLFEPLFLHKKGKLTDINWRVLVPNAKHVAVVIEGEWFKFTNKGGRIFEAQFSVDHIKDKDSKIALCCSNESDGTKFGTLLEYTIS